MPDLTVEALQADPLLAQRARIEELESQVKTAAELASRLRQELRPMLSMDDALRASTTMLALQKSLEPRRATVRPARGWLRALK